MWRFAPLLVVGCAGPPPDPDPRDTEPPAPAETAETGPPAPPPPSCTPADGTEPACVLGWGEAVCHPIAPGDEVPVVRGNQGRWHVPGAVRCTGIDPGRSLEERPVGEEGIEPAVSWRVETPEGAYLGGYPLDEHPPLYRPMRTPDGPAILGELLVLYGTDTYEEAVDRDAVMRFRLVDKDGVTVQAEVPIRLVAPDGT